MTRTTTQAVGAVILFIGLISSPLGAILRVSRHHRQIERIPNPTPDDLTLPLSQPILWALPGLLLAGAGVWLLLKAARSKAVEGLEPDP